MREPIFHRRFDYDRRLLPNRHLASLEEGVSSIEEARLKTGLSIGYPGWGAIYHLLLCHLDRERTETIVETGTNWGSTTIVLAQAMTDVGCAGEVLTFELDPDNSVTARASLKAAGLDDRVVLTEGDSRVKLPATLAARCRPGAIRSAFLDASHLEQDLLKEFDALLPYLAEDAIVFMDNTYRIAEPHEDQRVNGALRRFPSLYGGNLINLEFVSWYTPGLAIWQRQARL